MIQAVLKTASILQDLVIELLIIQYCNTAMRIIK